MAPVESQDARVQELIEHVQVHILPRRVRVHEFFKDFDKRNSGRCTVAQFARGLAIVGIPFSEDDLDRLATHYTDSRAQPPQVICYKAFCEEVDSVFKEIAPQREMSSSPSSTAMMSMSFHGNDVSSDDEERLQGLLHRLASYCSTRGVVFKTCFTDHDRAPIASPSRMNPRHSGKVTKQQFERNFPFPKMFSHADIELMCRKYTIASGDVHFMALHNDISEAAGHEEAPFPSSPLHMRPDESEWSHQNMEVIVKLRCKVVEKRIRVGEYFQDFDALRKGFCQPSQLKTVLSILNLSKEITGDDFKVLCDHYCREDGMFNYRAFGADLETGFLVQGLEKDPLAVVSMPDAGTTAAARRNLMTVVPKTQKKVEATMDKIQAFVYKRRLLMKPSFADMDKANTGVISRSQFQRVMATLELPVNEEDVGLLCSRYCNRGSHDTVDYKLFLQEMDPPDEAAQIAMQQQTEPVGAEAGVRKYFDFHGSVIPLSSDVHPLPAGW